MVIRDYGDGPDDIGELRACPICGHSMPLDYDYHPECEPPEPDDEVDDLPF